MHTFMHACSHKHAGRHARAHRCTHAHTHTHIQSHTRTHTHTHTLTHTQLHIHTHTVTHTNTHTQLHQHTLSHYLVRFNSCNSSCITGITNVPGLPLPYNKRCCIYCAEREDRKAEGIAGGCYGQSQTDDGRPVSYTHLTLPTSSYV